METIVYIRVLDQRGIVRMARSTGRKPQVKLLGPQHFEGEALAIAMYIARNWRHMAKVYRGKVHVLCTSFWTKFKAMMNRAVRRSPSIAAGLASA